MAGKKGIQKFFVREGDLFFVRSSVKRDGIGLVSMSSRSTDEAIHCGFVIRFRPNLELINSRFLVYLLRSPEYRQKIIGVSGGAAITNISQDTLGKIEINLPPLPAQRKIAVVLSAYDDLIEVNKRRIRLLEEMAQAVFREWFVEFDYPGHGKFEVVSSPLGDIPKGWTAKEMQEIADVIDCLHSKKPSRQESGSGVLLQLFNIANGGKLDMSEKYSISEDDYKMWTRRIEVHGGDCVITNVGRIAAVAQAPKGTKAALGRNMTGVRPRLIPPTYLIEYLLSSHMENEVNRKKDAGAIMDSLNVRGIIKLNVLIPPNYLLEKFEDVVRPMRRRIEILVEQNFNLRKTRDLLLPRLVSGEVSVEQVEL